MKNMRSQKPSFGAAFVCQAYNLRMPMPDLETVLAGWWGGAYYSTGLSPLTAQAANLAIGTNPPFGPAQLYALFPRFGGPVSPIAADVTVGSTALANVTPGAQPSGAQAIAPGQDIGGPTLAAGTVLTAYDGTGAHTGTLSSPAAATAAQSPLSVYTAPLVPSMVTQIYCATAGSQLQQARWLELWPMAMANLIAHYLTLWLQSEGNPSSAPGQAAASGMARGFQVSKSADGLSVSYQPLELDAAEWGNLVLTTYGQQIISWGNFAGFGMRVIY